MKKKIALILLSATLVTSVFIGTMSVMAENDSSEKTEYSFKQAPRGTMKIGKITAISDNSITVALVERPERLDKGEMPAEPPTNDNSETPKEPELNLTGETITINLTDSVKIRTDNSEDADISSLSVDSVIRLFYNEDDNIIEISTGKFIKKDKFDDKTCKVGKITAISDNSITVALAERPERPDKDEIPAEPPANDNSETPKEPELNLTGETITINITDSIKIRTDNSEDSNISSLSVDSVVRLIYNENNELIEVSSTGFGIGRGHKIFNDENCKMGKITAISDNSITIALAEKPDKNKKTIESSEENNSESKEKPEMKLSEETITVNVADSVKIRTDNSEDTDISSLSVDSVVRLLYNKDNELIEISSNMFERKHHSRGFRGNRNNNIENTTEI